VNKLSRHTNEINSHFGPEELIQMLTKAMGLSHCSGDAILIPNILIPRHWLPTIWRVNGFCPISEKAIELFIQNGFSGDRTKMNLEGYPGLFRELFAPPPWIEVEP